MEEAIRYLLQEHLYHHIVIICLCVGGMLFSMLIDLIFGIKKARILGQVTTSTGYKKTCDKGKKYFTPFAVLMCIDIIASVILPAPFFAMIWAAWCIFCEFKSVREKSWTKEELRKAERTMNIVIENKEDIAELMAKLVLGESKKINEPTND
ncbi:MAG: hypothetical protein HDS08_00525 [Bacteroides sp.]|nr:hypothetical protein [Bacteroides sp.]